MFCLGSIVPHLLEVIVCLFDVVGWSKGLEIWRAYDGVDNWVSQEGEKNAIIQFCNFHFVC
jgi:hypothetical protein